MLFRRLLLILAFVVILLALGLAFADFHLARSQTNQESGVASARPGEGPAPQPGEIAVYVEPNGRLAAALAHELRGRAASIPQVGQLRLVDSPPAAGQPALYVDVLRQEIRWLGVSARADVQVELAYSSSGDLYFRGQDPPQFVSTDEGPRVQLSGRYTTRDTSTGLISLPGYYSLLAEKIANQLLDSLLQQLVL